MSHAAIFAVCVALLRGAILMTPTHSVGPVRAATDPDGSLRFAVISAEDGERAGWHIVDRLTDFRWGPGWDPEAFDDWSAFGAARLFVAEVGEEAALDAALRTYALHCRAVLVSPTDPSRVLTPCVLPRGHERERSHSDFTGRCWRDGAPHSLPDGGPTC